MDDVNKMVDTFNGFCLTLFHVHAPTKKITIKDKPKPWITNMMKFMMGLRDEAFIVSQKKKPKAHKNTTVVCEI